MDVVYDALAHPLDVVVTYPDESITTATVLYSLDGTTWKTADQLDFTNVRGKTKVWYKVTAEGFDTVTNYSYVTISRRAATVTAATVSKTYDGTPLSSKNFTTDGFVGAQGMQSVKMTDGSTCTNAGSTDNVIDTITYKSNTTAGNYTVTKVKGLLTVVPAATHPTYPEINRTYDGSTDTFEVTVPSAEIANPTIKYSLDGCKTWTTTRPTFTNAGEYPVLSIVEDPDGNHATVTNETLVTIAPRPITVKVNPAQMRDGDPEPAYSATVTCDDNAEALDLTEAAKLVYKIGPTGSLKVGQNTFHASGEEYQGNYRITYIDNILTIYDKKTIPYTVDATPVMYDGANHEIGVTVTDKSVPSPTILYSTSENGVYSKTHPAVKNVSQNGGTPVWFTITLSDSSYQPVKGVAILQITPRPVTVKADDKSKRVREDIRRSRRRCRIWRPAMMRASSATRSVARATIRQARTRSRLRATRCRATTR